MRSPHYLSWHPGPVWFQIIMGRRGHVLGTASQPAFTLPKLVSMLLPAVWCATSCCVPYCHVRHPAILYVYVFVCVHESHKSQSALYV